MIQLKNGIKALLDNVSGGLIRGNAVSAAPVNFAVKEGRQTRQACFMQVLYTGLHQRVTPSGRLPESKTFMIHVMHYLDVHLSSIPIPHKEGFPHPH